MFVANREKLAAYIKEVRERQRLTQDDVDEAIGKYQGYTATLETAKIGLPKRPTRELLAKALGITNADILIAADELDPPAEEDAIAKLVRLLSLRTPAERIEVFLSLPQQVQRAILLVGRDLSQITLERLGEGNDQARQR